MPAVLTPHAGELSRMTGADREDIEAAPLRHAREAAERYDAVVLLKGRHTVVARPDGRGAGHHDRRALAGDGGGRRRAGRSHRRAAGRGLTPFDAASVGSWLHGAAATYASQGGPLTAPRRRPGDPGGRARPPLSGHRNNEPMRPEIVVDLAAIRHNVRHAGARSSPPPR